MSEPAVEPEPEMPVEAPESSPEPEEDAVVREMAEEPEGAPEAPETPEPPAGESEAQMKRNLAKLESEATRHANRVSEIMGEAASVLEPCPRCAPNIPGFVFPFTLAPLDDEQTSAVLTSIGRVAAVQLKKDNYSHVCEECDGEGQTESGSHVRGQEALNCVRCQGKGWTPVGPERQGLRVAQANGGVAEDVNTVPEPAPDVDPWGRTPEHPDFGRMPQFVR